MTTFNHAQINEVIENSGFSCIGLRVMTGGVKVNEGDLLENSFAWVDGECSSEQLDGVCALDLEFDGWDIDESHFNKMMKKAKMYALLNDDEQVVIVGGMSSYEGSDLNEVVISDAECIITL